MKTCYYVKISVIAKPEDDIEKIKEKFLSLFPFNLAEKKVELSEKSAHSFKERTLKIYEVVLEKDALIKEFLDNLVKKLGKEKEILISQKESRLDDEMTFFIRIDKDKLLDSAYAITDSGNCVHIKMKIASFPATRENGLQIIEDIFGRSL